MYLSFPVEMPNKTQTIPTTFMILSHSISATYLPGTPFADNDVAGVELIEDNLYLQ